MVQSSKGVVFFGLFFFLLFLGIITYNATAGAIPQTDWTLQHVDSEELVGEDGAAVNSFDGDANTKWHTEWSASNPSHPHEIQIDLGEVYDIDGFRYLPRQDNSHGRITQYEFFVSMDGTWGDPVVTGAFTDDADEQEITFPSQAGQFVRLRALGEVDSHPWTSMAEINVLGTKVSSADKLCNMLITWDHPDSTNLTNFELRVNKDDSALITILPTLREWSGEIGLLPGENVFDMRSVTADAVSVWSNEAYYTPSVTPDAPNNLQIRFIITVPTN